MLPLRSAIIQGLIVTTLIATSLVVATQWAAAMLGSQPALGAAWCELFGLKLYAPWKLFVWWLAFDSQAPDVFARRRYSFLARRFAGNPTLGTLPSGCVAPVTPWAAR